MSTSECNTWSALCWQGCRGGGAVRPLSMRREPRPSPLPYNHLFCGSSLATYAINACGVWATRPEKDDGSVGRLYHVPVSLLR